MEGFPSHVSTERERQILEEVQVVNMKLDELRKMGSDTLGGNKNIGGAERSQFSVGKISEEDTEVRMSSMIKRVVEATGHGLDALLDTSTPMRSASSPAPIWTTTSHALRPVSWCVYYFRRCMPLHLVSKIPSFSRDSYRALCTGAWQSLCLLH